jgi:SAM-dependent methyltransferase
VATDRNREVSAERFDYLRCRSCGSFFIAVVPADLAGYYREDYYRFDTGGEPLWKREQATIDAAAYRVALTARWTAPGHLIEIGSGTGAFAVAAQDAGFDVSAIEMDRRSCDYLNGRNIRAICSDRPLEVLESLPPARAVALWHVLEHLPNPAQVLEHAAGHLETGGVLAIAVPNPGSLQFRLLKARWAHLDAPRHLCLVPPDALVARAADFGLRCIETTTNDPDGLACNELGWLRGFQSRPALGTSRHGAHLALVATRALLRPFERRGNRGSAVTLLLRKDA